MVSTLLGLALSSSNDALNLLAIPLANIEWVGVCEDAGVVLGVGGALHLNYVLRLGRGLLIQYFCWDHCAALE